MSDHFHLPNTPFNRILGLDSSWKLCSHWRCELDLCSCELDLCSCQRCCHFWVTGACQVVCKDSLGKQIIPSGLLKFWSLKCQFLCILGAGRTGIFQKCKDFFHSMVLSFPVIQWQCLMSLLLSLEAEPSMVTLHILHLSSLNGEQAVLVHQQITNFYHVRIVKLVNSTSF